MTLHKEKANAIRALSIDAIQKANSGHPGMPMGMADIAEVLWSDFLQHNPNNPKWINRDRFVLSNGHGSMLLYSLLHLSGYDVTIDDLKAFRQFDSRTPGHPEYGHTAGVETTTGPLGQGLAGAVGMALGEKILSATYNKDGFPIIDHYTYVFVGDGCLMEGISHEASSLAGTWGLNKLIVLYDDNGISIDGKTNAWFTDDTPQRFGAYGWNVIKDVDGHDPVALTEAIQEAQKEEKRPTLICCKTVIGYGSPNLNGTSKCHGSPLGDDEIALVRKEIGWDSAPFVIPESIQQMWDARPKGQEVEDSWNELFKNYSKEYKELALELERRIKGDLPENWENVIGKAIQEAQETPANLATRKSSLKALNIIAPLLPELLGGSADLSGSNLTLWSGAKKISKEDAKGNYISYGVREFGMSTIMYGLSLYGGFIPYGGTFLVFSDYARNAIRLAALMSIPSIFVLTHDSIGLGEDGPTHQPIEHIASLQLIPNVTLWRPCDEVETLVAWKTAIEHKDGPVCLALTRQTTPHQERSKATLANIERGGYILKDAPEPQAIIIATGSEVALAMESAQKLEKEGLAIRVVSMPCIQRFEAQDAKYRESVLPSSVTARIAIEAGVSALWWKYLGFNGRCISIETFGKSAPAQEIFEHFGFTVENICKEVKELL